LIKDIKSLFSSHKNVPYSVNIENSLLTRCFQSSELLDITHKYDRTLISLNLMVKGRNIVLREILGGIERASYSWAHIEKKINEVIARAEQLVESKGFIKGKYNAVLSPDSTYSLIHETIGHGSEADQIINGNSFLTNLTGYPIASDLLTVIDDPHIRNFGWAEFDDEGTKTQGTLILEDGILNQFLHSKFTAERMNSLSTGNARASSYLSPPAPRQSNIYIEPRDHSFEELLEEVKNGVFIGTTESASTSIFTGDFIVNSQYGYEINNGELGKLLLPVKYSGSSLEVLQKVTSIGSEVETIPALCLKEESKVYMGAISPAMSISKLNIY
jgi:TldD protein